MTLKFKKYELLRTVTPWTMFPTFDIYATIPGFNYVISTDTSAKLRLPSSNTGRTRHT
jgi:hypothetical protein